jgi:hypothetical protein
VFRVHVKQNCAINPWFRHKNLFMPHASSMRFPIAITGLRRHAPGCHETLLLEKGCFPFA